MGRHGWGPFPPANAFSFQLPDVLNDRVINQSLGFVGLSDQNGAMMVSTDASWYMVGTREEPNDQPQLPVEC